MIAKSMRKKIHYRVLTKGSLVVILVVAREDWASRCPGVDEQKHK